MSGMTSRDELIRELVTGGLDERAARRLATMMSPLAVFVMVLVPGHEQGPVATVELRRNQDASDSFDAYASVSDGIPHTLSAGSHISAYLQAPAFGVGELRVIEFELGVSNAAGTQKLIVNSPIFDLTTEQSLNPVSGLAQVEKIGTDLSYSNGVITTAAGGQYIAYCIVGFYAVGLSA